MTKLGSINFATVATANFEPCVVIQTANESDDDDEQENVAPVTNRRTASIYADTLIAVFGLSTQNATVVDLVSKLQQELQSQQLV